MAFGCRLLMLVERKEMLEGWKHEKARTEELQISGLGHKDAERRAAITVVASRRSGASATAFFFMQP